MSARRADTADAADASAAPPLRFPRRRLNPVRNIAARILIALGALLATSVIVYIERDCYQDRGLTGTLTPLDSLYYAAVTLSTTGYGDITPVCASSRAMNVFVVTPMRFLFLIVLVGTTVEVLTARTRQEWRSARWRSRVRDHTVIIGYGVKGRSAAQSLVDSGEAKSSIVVVARDHAAVDAATRDGYTALAGDARQERVLDDAQIARAARVVIATNEDDTTILVTLTVRRMAPHATIVAAARETANADVLRQSGANSVIPTAEAAGRLMGLSLLSSTAGELMEDLLDAGRGLEVIERDVEPSEVGLSPGVLDERGQIVLAVVRGGVAHRFDTGAVTALEVGDRLVVIRHNGRSGS